MDGIRDDEHVWRDVHFERQKKQLDRPPEERRYNSETKVIFGTRQAPFARISTNLYDRVDLDFATSEGDRRALEIAGSKGVEGWWVMSKAAASQMNRRVEPTPLPDNPYHADIILPADEVESWAAAKFHLLDFLASGRWQDRSPKVARPRPALSVVHPPA